MTPEDLKKFCDAVEALHEELDLMNAESSACWTQERFDVLRVVHEGLPAVRELFDLLQPRWVPCSERLPDKQGTYCVIYGPAAMKFYHGKNPSSDIEWFGHHAGQDKSEPWGWFDGPEMVTHWMPLPPRLPQAGDGREGVKIYLDDVRKAPPGWTLMLTVAETIAALKTGDVTHISLDHDLAEEHYAGDFSKGGTGYDVLYWLEDEVQAGLMVPPAIFIHTMNPEGRRRMMSARERIYAAFGGQMTWRKIGIFGEPIKENK